MSSTVDRRKRKPGWPIMLPTAALFAYVWWRIAWVSDDAYLMFRTIEVWFAGYGPNFNPGQRVWGSTSPLWFLLISGGRLLHGDLYWVSVTISGLLNAVALYLAWRLLLDPVGWTAFVLLFLGSRVLVDYSSSGLETPLTYALLTGFVWRYCRLFEAEPGERRLWATFLVGGLLLVTRHDLLLAIGFALGWVVFRFHAVLSPTRWARLLACAAAPLVSWTAFTVFYHGAVFPPPAYAKLSYAKYGDPTEVLMQGMKNLAVVAYDPASMVILFLGFTACVREAMRYAPLLLGGMLYLAVYVYHGGDWMDARIFVPTLILLLPLAVRSLLSQRAILLTIAGGAAIACLLWPRYPWSSQWPHTIVHHRGLMQGWNDFYRGAAHAGPPATVRCPDWDRMSEAELTNPNARPPRIAVTLPTRIDPPFLAAQYACGRSFAASDLPLAGVHFQALGLFSYFAGPQKFVLEGLLLDPLLTRLPPSFRGSYLRHTHPRFRPGHTWHDLPRGYVESLLRGVNLVEDPHIARLYEDVKLATGGDLLAPGRLAAIWRLNTGYDYGTDAPWRKVWKPSS